MKHLVFFILIVWRLNFYANDGSFYASGNNLIPLQETEIPLKKELLKFYVRVFEWMGVDVNFEFFNPGAEKKLTVGFVTPPADGDVTDAQMQHPYITDFIVIVNGVELEYKIQKMKKTSFSSKTKIDGNDFVNYFDVIFKPGLNTIKHTYNYKVGSTVELQRTFDYQITTVKRWANKQIDDFELQVHLDPGIFYVPSTFWKDKRAIDWKTISKGTIKKTSESLFTPGFELSNKIKMVHLNSGYLSFKAKNFAPDYDISIGEHGWHSCASKWCKNQKTCMNYEELSAIAKYCSLQPYPPDSKSVAELNLTQLGILVITRKHCVV